MVENVFATVLPLFCQCFSGACEGRYAQKDKGKQVFMAYDTLDSYAPATRQLLEENAVLVLSPGGNELFGWAWNKENSDESNEQK